MTKAILLTVCILSISGFAYSNDEGPRRAPGMSEEGGHMGPPPKEQKLELADIKFEYNSKNDLFKNAEEAKEYQSLFEKYKTSNEITDYFTKFAVEQRTKMDEMRKSGKPPEFSKMKSDREAEKYNLLKEIKVILEKKKKDNVASLALNEEVKCGGGKTQLIIEKATTDSMKDTSKVTKIILTEDELEKMKKDIKEEVKKEMMKEMADNRPKDEARGPRERESRRDSGRDEEERPKMAEGKGRKQMPGGGRPGGDSSSVAMQFSSQMSGQMGGSQMGMNQMGMGNSLMNMNQMGMGNSQMNMNQMGMGNSQMNSYQSRDQMIQNQIRIPQMNFNQPYANQGYQNQVRIGVGQSTQMNQMRNPQMGMNQTGNFQMRNPAMNMNQNYGYAYQSNTDQNYGMTNAPYGYNFMAPQMDYGYTGSNTMMPAAYSGQTNQYQQSTPSYSQYSFMGY
ncbi:hypothetical protein SHI21_20520 [Bacteriovorax sp. PP10]|uniref:DUF148 domain-containing protein n=1 Tax=Bacteriovorax antarcticus TaxID=3088717 RepID=A0ABU5W278_9BACT|nr:hypothetical protein [Bacteriovorax sp. PP10]MEA9358634.1 hypothetical protein [Bacteriovorax sp. PP10]